MTYGSGSLTAGRPEPLGASLRDGGINFAVFSQHAQAVEVCVFAADGTTEIARWALHGPHDAIFHGFLPGSTAGLVYGLRANGPEETDLGHRFDSHVLLLDPCAREIVGQRDDAGVALKARVAAESANCGASSNAPRHRDADVVLYEVHVKGFSRTHPGIPDAVRGTFSGLAHPAAIAHFKALGVTTLSLLPVQYWLDEQPLSTRGLVNYWGYNTLGFFCPDPRLSRRGADTGAAADEFRAMVRSLHDAGIEVILDVVFNHTAEGNESGPTISFRGLDNASWYRLDPRDPGRCENLTGCGNTVNVAHPQVTRFVLDCLRYWVQEMGVDGFRFDLAPVLGRTAAGNFDARSAFFVALAQDPVLASARLIAEPWDAGPDGYQLGRFPARFLEWNDTFRDAVRGYWLGLGGVDRGRFARRFTASDDIFHRATRRPAASVNFITAHDGFTLADLVSYSGKHNLDNGEGNRDGRDDELCANFGVEGASADPGVLARRERARRAMLATLMLAQGTPMLCAGDEIGNSQGGNNNAYCQDNAVGWLNWDRADEALSRYVSSLVALRKSEPLLRHDQWFERAADGRQPAIEWLQPAGTPLKDADWHDPSQHGLACLMSPPTQARQLGAHQLLLLFNPGPSLPFRLPAGVWSLALDSSGALPPSAETGPTVHVPAGTVLVLRENTSSPMRTLA